MVNIISEGVAVIMLRKLVYSLVELPDREVRNTEIAGVCKTSESMISQFFDNEKELSFYHYIAIVRNYAPERENEVANIVADEFINIEHRHNCRMAMEYASTSRNLTLLKKMIDSQLDAPKENKDWAKLYSILYKFQARLISGEEALILLEDYSPKFPETKALYKIALAMGYYWVGEYKSMYRAITQSEKLVETIKNTYTRESYTARVCEMFARMYLYVKNDPKKARFYAKNVLNSTFMCDNYKVHLYHLLGTSFLFECHKESVNYFEIYKDMLVRQNRLELADEVINKDIYFANVLWGIDVNGTETSDPLEECHQLARQGLQIPVVEGKEEDPFYITYKGIAQKSADTLLKAAVTFINNGNKFFANLPLNELKKFNGYIDTAETLLKTINIA